MPSSIPGKNIEVCVFGAALDTGNLGVSALGTAILCGLSKHIDTTKISVFDYARGTGHTTFTIGGEQKRIARCGAFHTRRLYQPESLWNIRMSARLGGLKNPAARTILEARVILDISGGDSFTDMYGPSRFHAIALPKLIALEQRKPLILLPQTYGPFREKAARRTAQRIVCGASMAWARDPRSFEVLQDLLGNAFDPNSHKAGVDVAFALPVTRPADEVLAESQAWLNDHSTPLVGFNVSGLLLNRPAQAAEQYGLKADYREVILAFLRRLLQNSDARVLLVPHVVTPQGHYESDIGACQAIATELTVESAGRVAVAPVVGNPCEVKWLVAQCDWFCGTRMHSTLAALSSGVPTAAISYSPKTLGVFETCAQGAQVADPRQLETEGVVGHLWQSWLEREQAGQSLASALPNVLQQAKTQMDEIATVCVNVKNSRTAGVTG